MISDARKRRKQERAAGHRSVYCLVFGLSVYVGLLVILAVAPAQMLTMLQKGTKPIPTVLHRYDEIGQAVRRPWASGNQITTIFLLTPFVVGVIFHRLVRDEKVKTYLYYAATSVLGVSMIVGAIHLLMLLVEGLRV